jgi:hypothetical protein
MSQCSKPNLIFTLSVIVVCRCLVSAPDSHQHTSANANQSCYLFNSCDTIMPKLEVSIPSYYVMTSAFTELHVCVRWAHLIYLNNLSNMFVRKWRAHLYTNLVPGKERGERWFPIWNSHIFIPWDSTCFLDPDVHILQIHIFFPPHKNLCFKAVTTDTHCTIERFYFQFCFVK